MCKYDSAADFTAKQKHLSWKSINNQSNEKVFIWFNYTASVSMLQLYIQQEVNIYKMQNALNRIS